MNRLQGKTAMVTGGFSGLGAHFVSTLAREGATVVAAGRRIELGRAMAQQLCAQGHNVVAWPLDVTDPQAVTDALGRVRSELGAIDVVVNNAGLAATAPALQTRDEDWRNVLDVNLTGVWNVARAAGQAMLAGGTGGSIINVASILGLRVAQQVPAYAASKAAVIQLTQALALEWARYRIRVNAIAPGYFDTDLSRDFVRGDAGQALLKRIPMRRLGVLGELDGPLLLLASDEGSFMTGSVLVVDGGHVVNTL